MAGKNVVSNIIISAKDRSSRVLKSIKGGFKSLTDTVFSLKTAVVGIAGAAGVGMLGTSFIDAARTVENYKVRLQVLLGSQEKGNRLFKEMADYASQVPFEFQEIMGGATQLAGILKGGVDEISQWMPLIGDLAAASGLGIQETTEQVSRMLSAGAASADLFRERGVLAMLGFQSGVSYSAEETKKKLMESWQSSESQFKGATDKMANTWDGLMSMMSDAWFQFRTEVMDAGVFDVVKDSLNALLERVKKARESGELQLWAAKGALGVVTAFKHLLTFIDLGANALIGFAKTFNTVFGFAIKVAGGLSAIGVGKLSGEILAIEQSLARMESRNPDDPRIDKLKERLEGLKASREEMMVNTDALVKMVEDSEKKTKDLDSAQAALNSTTDEAQKYLEGQITQLEKNVQQKEAAVKASNDSATAMSAEEAAANRLAEAYIKLAAAQGVFLDKANAMRQIKGKKDIDLLNDALREAERT